jgi:hypothetical protein
MPDDRLAVLMTAYDETVREHFFREILGLI